MVVPTHSRALGTESKDDIVPLIAVAKSRLARCWCVLNVAAQGSRQRRLQS